MSTPRLKIAVLCASRENPTNLRTIIGALHLMESGTHQITYVVAADDDDVATGDAVASLCRSHIPTLISSGPRLASLGAAWNKAAALVGHADMYAIVTDRSVIMTPSWDLYLADAYLKDDTRVIWWTTNHGPIIPIVPYKWIKAATGLFTDYFPFWFDDTWLHELSALVHGLPNFMVQASCFIQKKASPTTKRLRDLRLWMDFFIAKRSERCLHASAIRAALKLDVPKDMEHIEKWMKGTDIMWEQKWQAWESIMGDKSEPDASYLEAKKNAEDFLKNKA